MGNDERKYIDVLEEFDNFLTNGKYIWKLFHYHEGFKLRSPRFVALERIAGPEIEIFGAVPRKTN